MMGFGQCDSVWWNRYGSRIWRSSPPSFSQFTSPPAQNALSPAPVKTTTPTSGSAPAVSMASVISRKVSPVNALYCFGRLIVTRAIWSRTSYRRSRYAILVSASSGVAICIGDGKAEPLQHETHEVPVEILTRDPPANSDRRFAMMSGKRDDVGGHPGLVVCDAVARAFCASAR